VHYHNRRRHRPEVEAELEATYWESLDQMLARMDILSVNCPHTPSTFHLLNARRLKLMKPSALVVNTSRGEVIDENALTRALHAGELAGAGLDVYEHGTEINPRLREVPNVVLLPHMGSATIEGPGRDGREGHHQHQDLRRWPPPARPGRAGHAVARDVSPMTGSSAMGAEPPQA
jgi:glyoxylate reductase